MSGTFSFCPTSSVPETLVPDEVSAITFNGWQFASKPRVPFRRKFKVQLHGLRWYLTAAGTYDSTIDVTHNARALELFYQSNRLWDNFTWAHPHLGWMQVQFADKLNIPAAPKNSGGNLAPVEVQLVEYNPGFT